MYQDGNAECQELTHRAAYVEALRLLIETSNKQQVFHIVKKLLTLGGFTQNGRNRILHYSKEEWQNLSDACPIDDFLWEFYVSEVQELMGRMDRLRRLETKSNHSASYGRPFLTPALAHSINQLAVLKWASDSGLSGIKRGRLNYLLLVYEHRHPLHGFFDKSISPTEMISKSLSIQSAIRFLEAYQNELLLPPLLERRDTFDPDTQHLIDNWDVHWMEDGGDELLELVRDVPLFKEYDSLPNYSQVVDWFINTMPELDSNQAKRGWKYLNEKSIEWHEQDFEFAYYESIADDCPNWTCSINDHYEEWLSTVPDAIGISLIPIVDPLNLYEETTAMHHCVVSHMEECLAGKTRVFSIRDESREGRIATVEIKLIQNHWTVTEFKGRHNLEFIHRLEKHNDPLTILMQKAVDWYDKKVPQGFPALQFLDE